MKTGAVFVILMLLTAAAAAETAVESYTLDGIIAYAVKNNPRIRSAQADVETETYGVKSAQADRLPRLELSAGTMWFHYPTPITPIYGSPPVLHFPEFDTTIYDAGVSFAMPLYVGGRLGRAVEIARIRKSIAEEMHNMTRQEIIYNLTSAFYKILQMEKLLAVNEETVKQLEAHKKNVELFYKAGTVAKVELLKTETELAHANQAVLVSKNGLESAYELLKTLMGMEDMDRKVVLFESAARDVSIPALEECVETALHNRPDYRAAQRRHAMFEEKVRISRGRRLPAVNFLGEYTEKSGKEIDFKENWTLGVRLTMPLFEGGSITSEINRARSEAVKAKEDERALRLQIVREARDAYLNIDNASKRIDVASKAVESAKENLRIEQLRYKTGAGTSTDVIDAQTALLRAETDYHQAVYDRHISLASLRKAMGEGVNAEEVMK